MNKKKIAIILTGFLMLAYTAYVTPLLLTGTDEDDMLASATKAISKSLNTYSRPAEQYLRIDAPVFSFLPLDKILFNPKAIIQAVTRSMTPNPSTTTAKAPSLSSVTLPQTTENTLVNIFCSQKLPGNLRKTITGSGVLVGNDGTVLTNAHVAEWPLVADSKSTVVCLARSGSPASHSYNVSVVFISPEWVRASGRYISTGGELETGESDFALLRISNPDRSPLNLRTSPVQQANGPTGSTVNAVSYPADSLGAKGVNSALYIQREAVSISDQYTFSGFPTSGNAQADIIETTPSVVGQIGSSGGALTDTQGNLIGLITMTTGNGSQGRKSIRAISIGHIQSGLSSYHEGGLFDVIRSGSESLKGEFDSKYRASLTSLLSGYLSL